MNVAALLLAIVTQTSEPAAAVALEWDASVEFDADSFYDEEDEEVLV